MKLKGLVLINAIFVVFASLFITTYLTNWFTSFARGKTTELLDIEDRILCNYADLYTKEIIYDQGELLLKVENNGKMILGNLRLNIYYTNVNVTIKEIENVSIKQGEEVTLTADVGELPAKIRIQSMYCPKITLSSCEYEDREFVC